MKGQKILLYSLAVIALISFQFCKEKQSVTPTEREDQDSTSIRVYNDSNIIKAPLDIKRADLERNIKKLENIYFEIGHYYLNRNISDSAFYYFNKAKEEGLLRGNHSFAGKNLLNMAIIQANEGDYFGSEETATEALRYFKSPDDNAYLASVYNCLAISKTEQKDYQQAIEYYKQSLNYSTTKFTELTIKSNQAVVNIKAGNYRAAIDILFDLSREPILPKYPILKARIEDNLVYSRWLFNSSYPAEITLYSTLKIRERENDVVGQIANHSHLAQYFSENDTEKALYHARKMYELAGKVGNPDDRLEALQKLIALSNSEVHTQKFFSTYITLSDSVQTLRTQAKNQFALIRYEVEKNKEENLRLKAENAQKNFQILRQKVIVGTIVASTFISFLFAVFWYKRRKEKFEREKQEEVHRTEMRYSKKIHDEVANSIYFLMTQLENNTDSRPTKIIRDLDELYHKSRNISQDAELRRDMVKDFSLTLKNMIVPFGLNDTKIMIFGNKPELWKKLSTERKEEIYYTLNELMTNMKKHSEATMVSFKFMEKDNNIIINYRDNGVGLEESTDEVPNKSKGFINMRSRIDSIGGIFEIVNNEKNKIGLSIRITIPL